MVTRQKNRLAPISEEVWGDVVKQAESFSSQFPPVNLEEYAKAIGIQHIRYRPLISDAGLARNGDTLEVIINTDAPGVTLPAETTASVGDGTWTKFQSSLRFTVAHEIAHAFFMRAAERAKDDGLLEKHRSDVEEACKNLARLMLLPRQILIRELGEGLLDLDHVSGLIAAFRVSPEVFLRRFHLSDMNRKHGKLDGFIAFIQEREGRLYIKAGYVFGRHASDRFERALQRSKRGTPQRKFEYLGLSDSYRRTRWSFEGMAVNDLKLDKNKDIESFLRSVETSQLDLDVEWGNGEVIPCNLAFRRIHQQPLGFLVRVRVLGPVQKPGQRTLF
jgi:hypothetical protein